MTLQQFLAQHHSLRPLDDQRLGQRFVNRFVSVPWPDLFYQTDDAAALKMIQNYLAEYQYGDQVPPEKTRS